MQTFSSHFARSSPPKPKIACIGIAEHAGRQHLRRVGYNGVLPDRAVLVLIHNEPRIARRQDVIDVACLEQLGRGDADVRDSRCGDCASCNRSALCALRAGNVEMSRMAQPSIVERR